MNIRELKKIMLFVLKYITFNWKNQLKKTNLKGYHKLFFNCLKLYAESIYHYKIFDIFKILSFMLLPLLMRGE
uniref:Uncharacterized protein n=1 Tax=Strongyloides papillosus TaxID=174720 RepID=A0A0N5BDI2_STREA